MPDVTHSGSKSYRFESEMNQKSTIYALSTGSGRAGIAVVRVSGPAAAAVLRHMVGDIPPARLASLRDVREVDGGGVIDRGLVFWYPGPHSATGEDVAEFHLHGSPVIVEKLFSEFKHIEGLFPAQAGEFTRRAFSNGVLDLVEVEGLADLLASESEAQRKLAMRQFLGEASTVYEAWRMRLLEALAMAEAAIDFVEEADVVDEAIARILPIVENLKVEFSSALAQSGRAGAVRDGLRVVIAGPPNVGKSSLLNWLAGREAAIVADKAGTTRDAVEAVVSFGGLRLVLTDTAGLRATGADEIEKIGMARAESRIRDADILVWMTSPDVITEVGPERPPDLALLNKCELKPIHVRNDFDFAISLKSEEGLEPFRTALLALVELRSELGESAVVVRDRHIHAVQQSIRNLNNITTGHQQPLEVVAEELRSAMRMMSSITGRIDVEDLLGKIFSEFCIGK
jgi:tRNA modification GTPase